MMSRLCIARSITLGPAVFGKQPPIWSVASQPSFGSNQNKLASNNNISNHKSNHHKTISSNHNRTSIKNNLEPSIGPNGSNGNLGVKKLDKDDRASLEQLAELESKIQEQALKFFRSSPDYSIYDRNIVYIDNIRNIRTTTFAQYVLQMNLVKLYYSVNYTGTKLVLLNLVKNPEESYLRIRWRFVSKPGYLQLALNFWNFWNRSSDIWTDGISTLYVNRAGKVNCHVCDTIDIDLNEVGQKQKKGIKERLIEKSGVNV